MFKVALVVVIAGTVAVAQETRKAPLPQDMVLAAQVMLDAAGFSPGEIDGKAGANFGRALAAYQQSRGLETSGRADDATLDRLRQDFKSQPPVISYQLTDADIAGPFQPDIPRDLVAQSKLPSLDYRNPLEAIAEKFHASPALLTSLNPGQTFMQAGASITVPNVMPTEPPPPAPDKKTAAQPAPNQPVSERTDRGHEANECADGRRLQWPRPLLRARDHRKPARPAADRQLEGDRCAADAGVSLQPGPVLGCVARALESEDSGRGEQSGRRRVD